MERKTVREQHIAVFGESGSGKTVMVSSFYGATQEPGFQRSSLFDVVADDAGQGFRLFANYLGMRDDASAPLPTIFAATPYAFSVKLKDPSPAKKGVRSFSSVRLVWHDYPGEWFQKDVGGPEEARRRIDTFKALLSSDVAFLLVDAQRLVDHAGEEERYLKSLLGSYRTGLLRLKDDLLEDGKPLVQVPRIWVLALSKADLLPELDVYGFRDLMIAKAADDVGELRAVLERLVDSPAALSVGEDFVRFSSAKFEPDYIEVTERVGLDLILPMAAMLPFERHIRWLERKQLSAKLAEHLVNNAGVLAATLIKKLKFAGPISPVLAPVLSRLTRFLVDSAADLGKEQLERLNDESMKRHDHMAAVLSQFALDLDRGEEQRVLLRSKR
jgi:hypothetical protein